MEVSGAFCLARILIAGKRRHQFPFLEMDEILGTLTALSSASIPARAMVEAVEGWPRPRLLVQGNSLWKISEIADFAPNGVYRKLDFVYDRIRKFTERREDDLCGVNWEQYGRQSETDSQTLTLSRPNRKKRALVAVQQLCTAYANSGCIVLSHLLLDPGLSGAGHRAMTWVSRPIISPAFKKRSSTRRSTGRSSIAWPVTGSVPHSRSYIVEVGAFEGRRPLDRGTGTVHRAVRQADAARDLRSIDS